MNIFKIKKINNNITSKKLISGFTLIEVIIACSIITMSMLTLLQASEKGVRLSSHALSKSQASFLLEEGVESVKSIRDNDWNTITALSLDTPYHLFFDINTNKWVFDSSAGSLANHIPTYPIDGVFDRTVVISSVSRDSNDDIVTSGGSIDDGTKKVTINLTWRSSVGFNSKSLSFYISNIFN